VLFSRRPPSAPILLLGVSYHHLVDVAAWRVSDDNYVAARAAIVNARQKHPMAAIWDDGTTPRRDGKHILAGGALWRRRRDQRKIRHRSRFRGLYARLRPIQPFHTRVIAATVSEAPYVLDYLTHHAHQTDLRLREWRRHRR
jgi:TnpA family transposase